MIIVEVRKIPLLISTELRTPLILESPLDHTEEGRHSEDLPGQLKISEPNRVRVFILYCKTEHMSEELLMDMADFLQLCRVSVIVDVCIPCDQYPRNWNSWTEEMIQSSYRVILICTRPLYTAFTEGTNTTSGGQTLVEMLRGKFYVTSIVHYLYQEPSKFIPVFIDNSPDADIVPRALRTHVPLSLNVSELSKVNREDLQKEINNNSKFKDFKLLARMCHSKK